MQSKTARYYARLYAALGKDYAAEAARLKAIIKQYKRSPGSALLDVACGPAVHAIHLCDGFAVTGIDIEPAMVSLARQRCPAGTFHAGDMRDFDLGEVFDVVVCLFSSIGFMKTLDELEAAVETMARHVERGGALFIEPWIEPGQFTVGNIQVVTVDEPELKVARVTRSDRQGALSILDMQYLIATPQGLDHFVERYEMGLFEHEQYAAALENAGLEVLYDRQGLADRGLFIATKPRD